MIDKMVLSQGSCKSRHGAQISGALLCAEVITEGLAMDMQMLCQNKEDVGSRCVINIHIIDEMFS